MCSSLWTQSREFHKWREIQTRGFFLLGVTLKFLEWLWLIPWLSWFWWISWLSSSYWLSRYLLPRQTIMETNTWGLVPSNFLHSIRICTRDECMNIHTRQFSVFTSFSPFFYFLSFSLFLPSLLPLSFFLFSLSDSFDSFPTHAPVFISGTWDVMVPWVGRLLTHQSPMTWNRKIYFFPLPFKEVCCNFCSRSKVISSYSNVCRAQEFLKVLE